MSHVKGKKLGETRETCETLEKIGASITIGYFAFPALSSNSTVA